MKEVKPTINNEKRYNNLVAALKLFFELDKELISYYFPSTKLVRSMTCFKSLVVIAHNSKITKTAIINKLNNRLVMRSIDRLIELGYVIPVKKSRYIPCFDKFTVNTGYSITDKGKGVLISMFPDFMEILSSQAA